MNDECLYNEDFSVLQKSEYFFVLQLPLDVLYQPQLLWPLICCIPCTL